MKKIVGLILIFLLVVIIVPFTQSSQAAEIASVKDLTDQLLQLKQQYGISAQQETSNTMADVAQKRKTEQLKLIENNPEAFLYFSRMLGDIDEFPTQVQAYLEKQIEVEGTLTLTHFDNFDQNQSLTKYQLDTSNPTDKANLKPNLTLNFSHREPELVTGTKVKIKGIKLDQQVVLFDGDATAKEEMETSFQVLEIPQYPPVTDAKVLVILYKFKDVPGEPFGKPNVEAKMFTADNSVKNYFHKNSYNKLAFLGDVYGWYTIPYNSTDCCYRQFSEAALQKARQAGVNLSNYNYFVFATSTRQGCESFSGLADIGGSRSWVCDNKIGTYTHELGHNFGVDHASLLSCIGGKPIDDYYNCSRSEYGDLYDVMGESARMGHFNAPHKAAVGWLPSINVQTITSNGRYTLSRLEQNGAIKALKIPKANTNENYYLEYRQIDPKDLEPLLATTVRIWNGRTSSNTSLLYPKVGSAEDFLKDGESFYDPINKVSIKQINHSSDSVTIDVQFFPFPTNNFLADFTAINTLPKQIIPKVVAAKGYLFSIGRDSGSKSVYRAKFKADGTLEPWSQISTLPNDLTSIKALANSQDFIYLTGLTSEGTNTHKAIYFTKVNADGILTAWTKTSTFPNQDIYGNGQTLLVKHTNIYLLGSYFDYSAGVSKTTIYYAKVNANGTIGAWTRGPNVPRNITNIKAAISSNHIFITGGYIHGLDSRLTYLAPINTGGSVGQWINTTNMLKALVEHKSIIYNGYLFIVGGSTMQGLQNSIMAAKINTNGTLGEWSLSTALPKALTEPEVIINNNKLYIAAGFDSNGPSNVIYMSTLNISDSIPPTINITSPVRGALVISGTTIPFRATATDDLEVSKVIFYINNVVLCTNTVPSAIGNTYGCNWTVPAQKGVIYNLVARSYDKAGNYKAQQITVTSN